MTRRSGPTRQAFTLVETIAAIAILAVVGMVASGVTLSAITSWRDATVSANVHAELSTAFERIAKELRAVEPDPGAASPSPRISATGPFFISFNSGASIALIGQQLRLDPGPGAGEVILEHVSAFTIRTYDEAGDELPSWLLGSSCRAIRRIQVDVTVQHQGVTHSLRTRLFVRSAMSGVET